MLVELSSVDRQWARVDRGCDWDAEYHASFPSSHSRADQVWGPLEANCGRAMMEFVGVDHTSVGFLKRKKKGGTNMHIHQWQIFLELINLENFIATFSNLKENPKCKRGSYHGSLWILFAALGFLKDSHMSCGYSFQVHVSFFDLGMRRIIFRWWK